jgi:hypothetical protein
LVYEFERDTGRGEIEVGMTWVLSEDGQESGSIMDGMKKEGKEGRGIQE